MSGDPSGLAARQRIEAIIRSLEESGGRAAPVEESTALAMSQPRVVSDLVIAVMRRFPEGGTFLDAALSYLPPEKWPLLVEVALEALESPTATNIGAAESVICYASFQCPSALHAHLNRIFRIRPNAGTYFEPYPWRESGDRHLAYLQGIMEDPNRATEECRRAWAALCQTRTSRAIEVAVSQANTVKPPDGSVEQWLEVELHVVGFHREGSSLGRLCPHVLYHIQFDERFFERLSRPPWLAWVHPTWRLPGRANSASFGGVSQAKCSVCGSSLHRLLILDPVPSGVGITRLRKVELATCLSCLGWEVPRLFYRHDASGTPRNVNYDGPLVRPEFPVGPLREAVVGLAETPPRWYWQDWGCSNSRENLNRVGGEPCWIQNPEYPRCPSCADIMPYLFQLDSDLPTADGGEWLWGSGGILYGFWCDGCQISGFLWQCT